jgi:hypothetical protein
LEELTKTVKVAKAVSYLLTAQLANETKSDSISNWHHHYTKKRKELVDFIDRAIENHSSIICSL